MRPLLLFLAFLMAAPQLYALSGGPFDSSSNLGGLDKRRGTYETTIRGSNIIGYAFFSATSNLDSYGNSRVWVDGITCVGSASASINESDCLLMITASGGNEALTSLRINGFIDQKVRSSGYPYRASGEGRLEITSRAYSQVDRLEDLGVDFGQLANNQSQVPPSGDGGGGVIFDPTTGDIIGTGGGGSARLTNFIALLAQLDRENASTNADTTRRPIFGKTTQISMVPSALSLNFTDAFGNEQGPFLIQPGDNETQLEVISAINRINIDVD